MKNKRYIIRIDFSLRGRKRYLYWTREGRTSPLKKKAWKFSYESAVFEVGLLPAHLFSCADIVEAK